MNRVNEQTQSGASRNGEIIVPVCPACGATARRVSAHFCATCGRGLKDNFYAPADSLLASYHLQHGRPAMWFERGTGGGGVGIAGRTMLPLRVFASEGNTAAAIALILVCSALVPFVGLLFCPLAVFVGGFGLLEARFVPGTGGARLALCCIVSGFVIAGAQILLLAYI